MAKVILETLSQYPFADVFGDHRRHFGDMLLRKELMDSEAFICRAKYQKPVLKFMTRIGVAWCVCRAST